MRRVTALVIFSLLLGPWLTPPAAQAAAPAATETPEQWRVFEIALTSTAAYANPFLDVDVTAVFTGPSGQVISRPGFWDGGDQWKVRVAFPETGRWSYQITASDTTNAGLNPPPGSVECGSYTGPHAIYQHGFLQVSATGRYLEHADGTAFFWLGDTHWFFDPLESWDSSDDPRWPSQFRAMVDRRVEQGYSVYQSVIFSKALAFWEAGSNRERLIPEYFRDQLDHKMQYLADQGLVNAFGLGFHSNIDGTVEATTRLAEYVVARYGAYPMVWITAGEAAGYDPALRQARIDGWREVALAIDRLDAYNQPQTAHYTNSYPTYYQGEPWHDFTMLQGAHGGPLDPTKYLDYARQFPGVPLLEGEANYEQIFSDVTAELVRQTAYSAIQAGSFGYTYGAQGIWNAATTAYDLYTTTPGLGRATWNEAIDFPGGQQMAHLKRFYTTLPWHTLTPRPTGWVTWSLELDARNMPLLSADDAAENIVIYFPPGYDPTATAGTLAPLPGRAYSVRWFNPRTGQYWPLGSTPVTEQWVIEPKPDGDDWLLWLRATSAAATTGRPDARGLTNLALNQRYRSSSSMAADQAAAQAFDGAEQTHWQAADDRPISAQWLEVDFGAAEIFNAVSLTALDARTRSWRLDVWAGTTWTTVARGGLIDPANPHLIRFATAVGTRARLVFGTGLHTPIIREMALYRLPGAACAADRDVLAGERGGAGRC